MVRVSWVLGGRAGPHDAHAWFSPVPSHLAAPGTPLLGTCPLEVGGGVAEGRSEVSQVVTLFWLLPQVNNGRRWRAQRQEG